MSTTPLDLQSGTIDLFDSGGEIAGLVLTSQEASDPPLRLVAPAPNLLPLRHCPRGADQGRGRPTILNNSLV